MSEQWESRRRRVSDAFPPPPPPPPPTVTPPPVQAPEPDAAPAELPHLSPLLINPKGVRKSRARSPQGYVIFHGIMNVVAPLAGLALGWLILGTIRPELGISALLSGHQRIEVEPQRPRPGSSGADESLRRSTPRQNVPTAVRPQEPPPTDTVREPTQPLLPVLPRLDSLPEAVDLPQFGEQGTGLLAQLDTGAGHRCTLSLISGEIADRSGQRLQLIEKPADEGPQTWVVSLSQDTTDAADALAEFMWDEGQLLFRWRYATAGELRAALVNSLLNVKIADQEKLIQLRTPWKPAGLTLDLTQKRLRTSHDLHHLPSLQQLQMTVNLLELPSGLSYELEQGLQTTDIGRKLPIKVTTPPGVNFDAWLASIDDKLVFHMEGHYRMPGMPPLEFTQQRVETQARSLLNLQRAAVRRLPALQRSLVQSTKAVSAAENRVRHARNIIARGVAQSDLSLLRIRHDAIQANIVRTQQAIPVLARNFAALQEFGKLGNQIHNQAIVQYKIHLPIEYDGISFDVVLLETSGRASEAPQDQLLAFNSHRLIDAGDRSPVPPEDQRDAARKQLAADYRDLYLEARDAAAKQHLAEVFVQAAAKAAEDLPQQFELFRLAWMTLAPVNLDAALEIADQIELLFDVQRLPLRAAVVQAAAKAASSNDQKTAVVQAALNVSDDATVANEDLAAAAAILTLAEELVQTIGNPQLRQQVHERMEILRGEQRLAAEEEELSLETEDVEKRLRVGRLGLSQGRDWERCMTTLAAADDTPLAEAARLDLSLPEAPAVQKELADRWFELAKSEPPGVSQRLQERAAFWYAQALPHLTGLSHATAAARLKMLQPDSNDP